jgi:hypothetical protein
MYRLYKTNLNAGRVHTLSQASEACFQVKHPSRGDPFNVPNVVQAITLPKLRAEPTVKEVDNRI